MNDNMALHNIYDVTKTRPLYGHERKAAMTPSDDVFFSAFQAT